MSPVEKNKRWVKSSNCCLLLVLFFGVQQNNRQENTDNFVELIHGSFLGTLELQLLGSAKPILKKKPPNWVIT